MNKLINDYKVKIEIILGNRLGYNEDNESHINDVKTWLCCEWQCSMFDMDVYVLLKEEVDEIAKRMIREF